MLNKKGIFKKHIFRLMIKTGIAAMGLEMQKNRLQILAYHGICEDEDINLPWISSNFISVRQFDSQMSTIRKRMMPIDLEEAVSCLKNGIPLPPRSVAVTFDDGYKNNLKFGGAILGKYKIPATIFLSTGHVSRQENFHFDKLYIMKALAEEKNFYNNILQSAEMFSYKESSVYKIRETMASLWDTCRSRLTKKMVSTLSPMTWQDAKEANALFSFGAHTHNHAILSQLTEKERVNEIFTSIEKIQYHLGIESVPFSYPNGTQKDFGTTDIIILKNKKVPFAVTMIGGSNDHKQDLFKLRRRGISREFTQNAFEIELSGIRGIIHQLK
jgi:peptidoglycan/xylan/chitin deacetylase (PgdA/CDA1 family)